MSNLLSVKLLILFAVSFSLVSISGPMASYSGIFPHVNLARAGPAPATNWIPAGPAMDTEKASIFTNLDSELLNLITPGGGKPGSIDLTDQSLSSSLLNCLQNGVGCPAGVNSAQFSVTSRIAEHGYFELEFLLSNNFWGVPFHFGSDAGCTAGSVSYSLTLADPKTTSTAGLTTACPGVSIRQGLAHLLDKNILATSATRCVNVCTPIDNPVPPRDGLVTPNSCSWDTLFPSTLESAFAASIGATCGVGISPAPLIPAGGISYHFATATSCGVGTGCATVPLFPWEPGLGTPDFCAAADHLITAGLATGKDPNTCMLTGIAPGVTAHTVNVFATNTVPSKLALGQSIADEICALFTGVFGNIGSASCPTEPTPTTVTSGPFVTLTTAPFIAPPGLFTSTTPTIGENWWIYTAAFINVFPFDTNLYGIYNSTFASNNGSSDVPPCSTASVPTSAASDYMYNCIPLYDQLSNAMEFSSCVISANSPSPGQTNPTFGNCTGGVVTGNCNVSTNPCDSVSAGYQTENLFGQQVVTIPVFAQVDQFGYLSDMANVINSAGTGIPNFYTWLNTHTSTPAAASAANFPSPLPNCPGSPPVTGPDCFRQGFAANTVSLNPYDASTFWDFNVIGNIYDSLLGSNPANNGQLYGYMSTGFPSQLSNSQLGYTPAAGTTVSYRFTLRGDMSWQDGAPLTSWDVKFSYITLKATGAFQATGLSQLIDVHVLSKSVFDVNLSIVGPFTLFSLGSPTVIPGRHWSASGLSAWDSAVTSCVNSSTPDSCFITANPSANTVPATRTSPTFDPLAAGILIGSGPWQCVAISGLPNPSGVITGGGCSSTGFQNPGAFGYYQLTRYGAGTTPGTAVPSSKYFRSSGTLAVSIWSGNNGQSTHDFINSSTSAFCYLKLLGYPGCTQWQQGIGNLGGQVTCIGNYAAGTETTCTSTRSAGNTTTNVFCNSSTTVPCDSTSFANCSSPTLLTGNLYLCSGTSTGFGGCCAVGFLTVSGIVSFQGVRWTDPFNWLPGVSYACCPFTPNAPTGITALPLTLYEGISTGNAGNPFASGTPQVLQPAATAGCIAAYPTGGYDC